MLSHVNIVCGWMTYWMDYLVKPSVNKAVSTYAVKIFLQLITRYFPKSHSIIVKVSYSCIENISKIYTGHNSKIISTQCSLLTLCYCQVKEEFSMGSNCQTTDAVSDFTTAAENILWADWRKIEEKVLQPYKVIQPQAIFTRDGASLFAFKLYVVSERNFKWNSQTEISSSRVCHTLLKKCLLYLYGKLVIITYSRQHKLVNKQSKVFCKCCHENKYLLKNFNDKG